MPRTKKKRTGEPGGAETVARMLKRVDEGVWEVPGAGGGRLVKGRFLTLEDAKLAMLAYSLELEATRRRPEPFADELVALVGPGLDGADADAE